MNSIERVNRLRYLEECIRKSTVKSVRCIKLKFNLSERSAHREIKRLKQMGVPVSYSRIQGKFVIKD